MMSSSWDRVVFVLWLAFSAVSAATMRLDNPSAEAVAASAEQSMGEGGDLLLSPTNRCIVQIFFVVNLWLQRQGCRNDKF